MLSLDAIMKWKRTCLGAARLVAQAGHLGSMFKENWIGMDKNRHAILPILCERGIDQSVLIIAFSGGARKLDVPVHEFFETTKTLGYNRILLWDKHYMFYHYGVDRQRRDWRTLIGYLQQEIARLRPSKVFCVGTSSGGYAAVIAGHYLKADFVHAFSPQTKIAIDPKGIWNARHPIHRWRMSISRRVYREVLDLAPMLSQSNGETRYFVHYGAGHTIDRRFAERIAGMPSVTTIGYQCNAHAIAIFLAKKKFLDKVLVLENQNRLAEIARDHFGETVRIASSASAPTPTRPPRFEDISESNLPTM
jgi:hypothetical protein